jgi:hypothetical protein
MVQLENELVQKINVVQASGTYLLYNCTRPSALLPSWRHAVRPPTQTPRSNAPFLSCAFLHRMFRFRSCRALDLRNQGRGGYFRIQHVTTSHLEWRFRVEKSEASVRALHVVIDF